MGIAIVGGTILKLCVLALNAIVDSGFCQRQSLDCSILKVLYNICNAPSDCSFTLSIHLFYDVSEMCSILHQYPRQVNQVLSKKNCARFSLPEIRSDFSPPSHLVLIQQSPLLIKSNSANALGDGIY